MTGAVPAIVVPMEASSALTVGYAAGLAAGPLVQHATANTDLTLVGVVYEVGASQAPYMHGIQTSGVARMISDGSGTIAVGDTICVGGTAGQIKKITQTDGTTPRQIIGKALSATAATQGLAVYVLLAPYVASMT